VAIVPDSTNVYTFGHGRLTSEQMAALLTESGIRAVVDVRRFPGSRSNPAAARGAIQTLTTGLGIDYRWEERLGGRRRLTADQLSQSPDTWWQVPAFRAYAAWTRTADFDAALEQLLAEAENRPVAIMCSETPWWRCHRRLISDVAELRAAHPVLHLMPGRDPVRHQISAGARLWADGLVVWDGPRG